tara:strand:+ start:2273 stop:2818 length:546 start_codon:yes stop_codon:yes gene_type:complete
MNITIIPTKKRLHNKTLSDYRNEMRHYLMTSRFNEKTWLENQEYREKNSKMGCIYCSPNPVSMNIPHEGIMFILEMNNDTNEILGVGMVANKPKINKNIVYENGNYNRYNFSGNHRICRAEMTAKEEDIMCVFEILCFTGNRHMKRGQGLTMFPVDMLYKCHNKMDLLKFVRNMFKTRYSK